jgi:F-type H+-transporting ATPase subunit epsilon
LADENKIRVEILTPEGQVFDGEVAMVSTRTKTGSLGILANHAPLMAMLDPTELALYDNTEDGLNANHENATRFAQAEGYLQVADNRVLVLVEEAIPPDQVDRGAIESKLDEARRGAEDAEGGSEARARFERDARRYEAFLSVVSES